MDSCCGSVEIAHWKEVADVSDDITASCYYDHQITTQVCVPKCLRM